MPEIRGDDLILAYITAGSKREAPRIGRLLVEEWLAARRRNEIRRTGA